MKKYIPFLIFILLLSSCSNWKYGGKTKVTGAEFKYAEVVIEKNKVEPLVFDVQNEASKDLALTQKSVVQSENSAAVTSKTITKLDEVQDVSWVPYQDKVVENEDSLKKQDEVLNEALKTEKEAKKSTVFGILGVVLSFTPVFIAGLIFSVNGLKRSTRALKAQYITPRGLKFARTGLILSIIGLVISSILLIALFILLLLFVAFL